MKKYISYIPPPPPQKKLYSRKWNFLAPRLKTFLYFFRKKFFLCFQKWNFLALRTFQVPKIKKPHSETKILIFEKCNFLARSLKSSNISEGNFKVPSFKMLFIFFLVFFLKNKFITFFLLLLKINLYTFHHNILQQILHSRNY